MSKFPLRLKELRNSQNLSQQKLADRIRVSKSSINMYERGEREPGIETLEAIADFFNVDLDYLIGKSNIPNRSLSGEYYNNQQINKTTLSTVSLSKKEQKLLDYFRNLNESGQKYLIQTAVIASQMYPKHPTVEIAAQGRGVQSIETKTTKEKIQKVFDELD